MKQTYLGDGLYAEFDGEQIRLFAERMGQFGRVIVHEVFLDMHVLSNFAKFVREVPLSFAPENT